MDFLDEHKECERTRQHDLECIADLLAVAAKKERHRIRRKFATCPLCEGEGKITIDEPRPNGEKCSLCGARLLVSEAWEVSRCSDDCQSDAAKRAEARGAEKERKRIVTVLVSRAHMAAYRSVKEADLIRNMWLLFATVEEVESWKKDA